MKRHCISMRRAFKNLGLCFGLALLTACAGLSTRLPDIATPDLNAEKAIQAELALVAYHKHVEELLRIGHPILRENAALCSHTRPDIGILTHKRKDYDKRLQGASVMVLGTQDQKSIFHIAPNSPAAQAGLKAGDVILDSQDVDIGPYDKAFKDSLVAGRQTELRLRRNGEIITRYVTAIEVCDYRLNLKQSSAINAYADGNNITVTSGMMDFIKNENELAMIIGHELAHNTLAHIRKIFGNYIMTLGATRYTRPFESEADYVGLYYQVRAGYSPDGVEEFWRRLARINPKSVGRAKTHPTFPNRYLSLAATRAEIRAKQARGELLVPNFKNADK